MFFRLNRTVQVFLLATPLFLASNGWATLTITDVSGASSWSSVSDPATPAPVSKQGTAMATITGGMAGTCQIIPAAPGPGMTCNTCDPSQTNECSLATGKDQSPLCSCNMKAIYDGLSVTITVESDKNMTTPVTGAFMTNSSPIATGVGNSVTLSWGQICGVGSCMGVNGTFMVYIYMHDAASTGNYLYNTGDDLIPVAFQIEQPFASNVYGEPYAEGIGAFSLTPGDGEIALSNILTSLNFPELPMINGIAANVVIMASTQAMKNLNVSTSEATVILPVGKLGSELPHPAVTGLKNNSLYYVRVALMDQAGNIMQYFPANDTLPSSCLTAGDASCPYSATPTALISTSSR